jgi:hypothetical protein
VESQETIYKKFIIEHYISVEGHGLARDWEKCQQELYIYTKYNDPTNARVYNKTLI